MDIDRDALVREFMAEVEELLDLFEQSVLALESDPSDAEALNQTFRIAHTVKGSALCVGFDGLGALAHILEDSLDRLRSGSAVAGQRVVTWLLEANDVLRAVVESIASGGVEQIEPEHEQVFDTLDELTRSRTASAARPAGAAKADSGVAAANAARTLRVDVEKLDQMVDLAGEIAVARARLRQRLEELRETLGEEVLDCYRDVDRLSFELQEFVMNIRMVPVGPTFRQFHRTVRDTAAALGKQARLIIEGEDVEVDTRVVERLKDPLLHMIRNAVDHGLEAPEVRTANQKDPVGTIRLTARHEAGTIVIIVEDDGAGIDQAKVLARARRERLVGENEQLTESDVLRLVFQPGFSTAEAVTDVSGRGVGLDVVRRNIEELHGTLVVENGRSGGSRFVARLPLTLAIIDGFVVEVGDGAYVIPLESVVECVPAVNGSSEDRAGVVMVRDEVLPYINLRKWLAAGGAAASRQNMVIVQHDGIKAGLVVDLLRGEMQTVIKPLGRLVQNVRGVSASSITGDGRVALILDIQGLLSTAVQQYSVAHAGGSPQNRKDYSCSTS